MGYLIHFHQNAKSKSFYLKKVIFRSTIKIVDMIK